MAEYLDGVEVGGGGGGGVSDHGALTGLADDDHTQYALVQSGAGAPSTTPNRVSELYRDTTNDEWYIAKGTSSSADWVFFYAVPQRSIVAGGAVTTNTLNYTFVDGNRYRLRVYSKAATGATNFGVVVDGETANTNYNTRSALWATTTAADGNEGSVRPAACFGGAGGAGDIAVAEYDVVVEGTNLIFLGQHTTDNTLLYNRVEVFRFDNSTSVTSIAHRSETATRLDNDSYIEVERIA